MRIIIGILLIFLKYGLVYSCNNLDIHKKIVKIILSHEGEKILKTKFEYSKYGIRNSILKEYNIKHKTNYNIKSLNKNQAMNIALYLMKKYNITKIELCNLKLIIYDSFYNAGPKAGALITQRTLNKYHKNKMKLIEDGIFGSETIKSLNNVNDLEYFFKIFTQERLKYYSSLKNWNTYKKGWIKRINSYRKVQNFDCSNI